MANKIPDKLLSGTGLKKGKTPDGKDVLIPDSVTDTFKKVLAKAALSGSDAKTASTSQFLNLFNYYLQNVLESKSAARLDRYEQMDFIIENDPALSITRRVLIDEILQVDTYNQPITVTSPNLKFKAAIEGLFAKLGFKSYLREIASNLITYGDSFVIMDIQDKNGVTKLIPVDPRDVRHRFEFSLAELEQNKLKIKKKFTAFQAIIDLANTIETQASQFNKVLLGFQILNTMFPFWQILHARQFTTRNVLAPFGKPTFYESQSEARMYLNAKVVVSMIRSSAFMREHIKIKTNEDEDPATQWEKCQEIKQFMEMFISSNSRSSKDYPSFGEKLYYPQGLIEIEKMEAGYNFRDRFEDLEIMRQDVFTSTGLPKEYFVGGEMRQYVSNKSLISQDKKAARQVFALQNQMIDQMIKTVEVNFSFTEEFDPYKEQFGISLPYPVPDTDDSVISLSQSKMTYAISVIDNLKQSLDITRIPTDIVRGLLTQYFPLKDEEIDKILHQMSKDSSEEDEIGFNRIGMKAGDPFLQNRDMMAQQIDTADSQSDSQNKMVDQQVKMQDQQIKQGETQMQQPEAGAEQQPGGGAITDPGQAAQAGKSAEEITKAIEGGDTSEKTLQAAINLSIMTKDEAEKIKAQGTSKVQQMAAHFRNMKEPLTEDLHKKYLKVYRQDLTEQHLGEYHEAVEKSKKSIQESFLEIHSKTLLEQSEEFVWGGRHYLTNAYVSPDRNITGIVNNDKRQSLNEIKKNFNKKDMVLKEEDKGQYERSKVYKRTGLKSGEFESVSYLDNNQVIKDTVQDRRYDNKGKPTDKNKVI